MSGGMAREIESALEQICKNAGFPRHEEFKWSPRRDTWMWSNLTGQDRERFFHSVLDTAADAGVDAHVVVEDTTCPRAIRSAPDSESSAAWMFLERAHVCLERTNVDGVIVIDTPSGARDDEARFVRNCYDILIAGTEYHQFSRFAINVVCGDSRHIRMLQLADLVTSCTTARIAGETRYSPAIFDRIVPLLRVDDGRCGGVGLKIWPNEYRNLYHWLLRESFYRRRASGDEALPVHGIPYAENDGLSSAVT